MAAKMTEAMLRGRWLHAHEEDEPGRIVFRPASHQLPPARGRVGFDFRPEGRLARIGSGPTDQTTLTEGHWSVDSEGRITIRMPGRPDEILEVLLHAGDRLVLKKT